MVHLFITANIAQFVHFYRLADLYLCNPYLTTGEENLEALG